MNTQRRTIKRLIRLYKLKPHPEGGCYAESYRSAAKIYAQARGRDFPAGRSCCTAIYYLLEEGDKSCLHRIKSDEIWHFYSGGPLKIAQIFPDGRMKTVTLGGDIRAGCKFQHVVPAGCWFGAYPAAGSGFSFVGCTVAPGFDFSDFEPGGEKELLSRFPKAARMIEKLTA